MWNFIFWILECPLFKCTQDYQPVCGTDGKTYQNQCHLSIEECRTQGKITKKHDGACEKPCTKTCDDKQCGSLQQCFLDEKNCITECRKLFLNNLKPYRQNPYK